jgi:AraC-like DNA-binding protein
MRAEPVFRMFLWSHRLLLLGRGFGADLHRHHAAQLCWALDGAVRLRPASDSAWREAAGFFIAPDQPHELDAGAVQVALLYLDAQSAEYAAYVGTSGYSNIAVAELPSLPVTSPLRRLMASRGTCAQAAEAIQVILGLTADVGCSPIDPRIARTLRWIDANLQGPIRIAKVAEVAGLSESHFAHLFVQMTGVPVRRYVLWRRLGAAVTAATRGASLTEAAYAAGLADSSHLSRAFRSTFGLTPSFLFEHRALLDGQLCERATSSVSHD